MSFCLRMVEQPFLEGCIRSLSCDVHAGGGEIRPRTRGEKSLQRWRLTEQLRTWPEVTALRGRSEARVGARPTVTARVLSDVGGTEKHELDADHLLIRAQGCEAVTLTDGPQGHGVGSASPQKKPPREEKP
ncbi:hypothetical protein KEM60_00137 [Austwickia sp. TVS 96-490-7B]|nr:hypothetical protein [Austwickia sp. TVS 96-490-7B]